LKTPMAIPLHLSKEPPKPFTPRPLEVPPWSWGSITDTIAAACGGRRQIVGYVNNGAQWCVNSVA
jgi:hypothetical protein